MLKEKLGRLFRRSSREDGARDMADTQPIRKKLRRPRGKKAVLLVVLLVVVIAAIVYFGVIRRRAATPELSTTNVQSTTVATGDVSTTVSGTGTLANSGVTDIDLYDGLEITSVLVSAGDTVTAGQELATVDTASVAELLIQVDEKIDDTEDEIDDLDSDDTLEKVVLESKLSDLEAMQTELETMYETGKVTASTAGVISAVNVEDGTVIGESSGSSSSSGSVGAAQTSSSSSFTVQNLSGDTVTLSAQNLSGQSDSVSLTLLADESGSDTGAEQQSEQDAAGETDNSGNSDNTGNTNETASITADALKKSLTVTAPQTGAALQSEIQESDSYTGKIEWNPSGTAAAGTTYTAAITLTAKSGYAFSGDYSNFALDGAQKTETKVQEDGTLLVTATYQTAEEQQSSGTQSGSDATSAAAASGSTSTTIDTSGLTGSTASSGSSGTSASASATTTDSSSTVESSTGFSSSAAFSVASGSDATIDISVDELDINSIAVGNTATVTMDAFEGESFEGSVTNIDLTATTGSGSSKYTVEITVPKEDGMLEGMSASAVINIEQVTDVLTIPVDALQERGDSTFVYTEQSEDGTLSGEVEVETGLSDGTTVEIKSGLSEGDTVYYEATGSDSSTDATMPGGDFSFSEGGGEMPSGGDMTGGGGEMPSGGGGGDMPGGGGGTQ